MTDTVSREMYNNAIWRLQEANQRLWRLEKDYNELEARLSQSEQSNSLLTVQVNRLTPKPIHSSVQEAQIDAEQQRIDDAIDIINQSPIKDELIEYVLNELNRE